MLATRTRAHIDLRTGEEEDGLSGKEKGGPFQKLLGQHLDSVDREISLGQKRPMRLDVDNVSGANLLIDLSGRACNVSQLSSI